jgi:hypothetical protein
VYAPYDESWWLFNKNNYSLFQLKNDVRKLLLEYNLKEELKELKEDKIVILIKEWGGCSLVYHHIVLGVLLKIKGMEVSYLFCDTSIYGNLVGGSGFSQFQNESIELILKEVKKKFDIDYKKLSNQASLKLNLEQRNRLEKLIYYNNVWHSKKIIFDEKHTDLLMLKENLTDIAERMNSYLKENDIKKSFSFTGIHADWGIWLELSKLQGNQVYTFEKVRNKSILSISGPAIYQKDILYFEKLNLKDKQLSKLIKIAESHLKRVFKSNDKNSDMSGDYVVIPLNIFWDSASYTENDIFVYFDQWLSKTIHFLLNECGVEVYVRQHPHERKFNTGKDVENLLMELFGDNPSFHFISSHSDINTYELIQNSLIVLPNTSTVGIEAAMMGKQVIVKNDVYYANSGFVIGAKTERDYFDSIKNALERPITLTKKQIQTAKIYFALSMLNGVDSYFGHLDEEVERWCKKTIDDLLNHYSVQWIINAILYDKPILYSNLEYEVHI